MNNNEFESSKCVQNLKIALYIVCALALGMEFFVSKTPHFGFDGLFGFSALLGFAGCAAMIFVSKILGPVLKRKEDYYDN